MAYAPNPDNHGWKRSADKLVATLRLWGVNTYSLSCAARPRYDARFPSDVDSRSVTLYAEFEDGRPPITVTVDRWDRPVDNLWAMAKGIDEIRLNETRGLADVARQVYLALPSPAAVRDPWEVLGVRSDAALEIAEAAYRQLAKSAHSDAGGDDVRMRELNAAIEAVRAAKK